MHYTRFTQQNNHIKHLYEGVGTCSQLLIHIVQPRIIGCIQPEDFNCKLLHVNGLANTIAEYICWIKPQWIYNCQCNRDYGN